MHLFSGGVGKMEVLDLPGFAVLLAGIALHNVYECVHAVKTRPGPYGSLEKRSLWPCGTMIGPPRDCTAIKQILYGRDQDDQ